jgi:hypothetical protein
MHLLSTSLSMSRFRAHIARVLTQAALVAAAVSIGLTLAPAAAPARGAAAFDPFGATDLNPCDPDVVGTDAGQRLSGGTKTDPAFGTVGLGVLGLGGNDTLVGKADGR